MGILLWLGQSFQEVHSRLRVYGLGFKSIAGIQNRFREFRVWGLRVHNRLWPIKTNQSNKFLPGSRMDHFGEPLRAPIFSRVHKCQLRGFGSGVQRV